MRQYTFCGLSIIRVCVLYPSYLNANINFTCKKGETVKTVSLHLVYAELVSHKQTFSLSLLPIQQCNAHSYHLTVVQVTHYPYLYELLVPRYS
jgi:hypothetical protein